MQAGSYMSRSSIPKSKIPLWLRHSEGSIKKKRSTLRTYIILRTLAKNDGLSIYALGQKILEDEGVYIPRPRLVFYLRKLEESGQIFL